VASAGFVVVLFLEERPLRTGRPGEAEVPAGRPAAVSLHTFISNRRTTSDHA
jgi:hypothetical protein